MSIAPQQNLARADKKHLRNCPREALERCTAQRIHPLMQRFSSTTAFLLPPRRPFSLHFPSQLDFALEVDAGQRFPKGNQDRFPLTNPVDLRVYTYLHERACQRQKARLAVEVLRAQDQNQKVESLLKRNKKQKKQN